jgi:NADH-quinone oxidoreductase subunit K
LTALPALHLMSLSFALFLIGLIGVLVRKNLLFILLGIEIMINGVAVLLVGAGAKWHQADGQIMLIFLLVIAAVEVSIGLALLVQIFRKNPNLDPDQLVELKD